MLLIFEIANNHNGDVNRGIEIIDNIPSGDYAIKLQFRHLETFIHPEFIDSDNKYVRRFLDTALTDDEYITLCDRIKDRGFRLVITPFDEISVEFAVNCGADILKVASCSALEWSLHEEICNYELPVIVSTAGLQISDIDKIVSFYKHKNIDLSLLHCVAEYPTDFDKLNMNFIDRLKSRYDLPIGYSGHEQPENFIPTIIALSKGACIIERHVGLDPLNAYSLDVENIAEFIHVVNESIKTCGEYEKEINMNEVNTLNKLRRGVYAFEGNKKGEKIEEFYFAFPLQDGCMSVQDFTRYRAEYDASRNYLADEPIVEHTPVK